MKIEGSFNKDFDIVHNLSEIVLIEFLLNFSDRCPSPFSHLFVGCYYIATDRALDWKDANTYCHNFGAKLAIIATPAQQKALVHYINTNPGNIWVI